MDAGSIFLPRTYFNEPDGDQRLGNMPSLSSYSYEVAM